MELRDEKARLRTRLEQYVEGQSFQFNRQPGDVDEILGAMVKRRERFGAYYCPCRVVSGDKEKDKNIICPCVYHLDELRKQGTCRCRLFVSRERKTADANKAH
ncbi:MAG: ferredoxin:thioredoxin reductase [Planctomycetota bacterium]|nr:ferredoxin:thioredoxin reductase [Planctomycetota bacterium]